jgi:hypothetical protein
VIQRERGTPFGIPTVLVVSASEPVNENETLPANI